MSQLTEMICLLMGKLVYWSLSLCVGLVLHSKYDAPLAFLQAVIPSQVGTDGKQYRKRPSTAGGPEADILTLFSLIFI
eukprot:3477449-Amphidinium_carterae.1